MCVVIGIGLILLVAVLFRNRSPESQLAGGDDRQAQETVQTSDVTATTHAAWLPYEEIYTPEINRAISTGAKGRITVKVVDSRGSPVPDAHVEVFFASGGKNNSQSAGATDSDGRIACEGLSNSDCKVYVDKEGYYRSQQRHSFIQGLSAKSVKKGRWQPWNPMVEIVLKEKRKPARLVRKRIDAQLPKGVEAHFDCLRGDWLPPLGEGKTADMSFAYQSECDETFYYLTNSLVLTMTQGGVVKLAQDQFSELKSAYEAPETQYAQEMEFEFARTRDKIIRDVTLSEDDYLVFYSDARRDGNTAGEGTFWGKLTSWKYGESQQRGHSFLRFTYYLNPVPGDRNLEMAGRGEAGAVF